MLGKEAANYEALRAGAPPKILVRQSLTCYRIIAIIKRFLFLSRA